MAQNQIMKLSEVKELLTTQQWRTGLELYITGADLEIFISDVMTAFAVGQNAEQLRNCMTTTTGQASVYYSLTHAASEGLSLNPARREARLATYWDKKAESYVCSYEVDKGGLIKKAQQAGLTVVADVCYENDELQITRKSGGDEYLFRPALKDRGGIQGYWCSVVDKNGNSHIRYMSKEQVDAHRDKYAKRNKDGKISDIWFKSEVGMGLKTIIKATLSSVNVAIDGIDDFSAVENTEPTELPPSPLTNTSSEELLAELKRRGKEEKEETENKKLLEQARF